MSTLERLEPDKAAYQEELGSFIRTTVANYPRTDAATKIKLTTEANRQFTRQYGVEVNLLMTKLFGTQKIQFGFDQDPELKHFALKIYGKVYEFGPYEEKVRKTLFLDWCADNLAFEFATTSNSHTSTDRIPTNGNSNDENLTPAKRQPVTTYTMKFEHEMDAWVKEFCEKAEPYHFSNNNCLQFVKAALDFLDPKPSSDSDMQAWIQKYCSQRKKQPSWETSAVQLPRVESTTSSTPENSPMEIQRPSSIEPVDDEEIECVNLASDDDETYELCEL